jgi:hypothetical protein
VRIMGRVLRREKGHEKIGVPNRAREGRPGSGH